MIDWIKTNMIPPPQGEIVMTKIDDEKGERNVQELVLEGNMFWTPDRKMYVYYCPTHWGRK